MTYQQSLDYIKDCSAYGIVPGLDTMYALMEELGNPQDKLSIIHIGGTNGKGSVGAFLEGMLKQKNRKTGRYISPSVFSYREKLTINSAPITEEDFAKHTEEVRRAANALVKKGIRPPTAFEVETAVAFLYFAQSGCDYVLLEVGMGGRLDATNIIKNPVACVLTSITKDHMAFLGSTIEEITSEKCGIIKKNTPVITIQQKDEVQTIIEDTAKKQNSRLVIAKEPVFKCFKNEKQYFDCGEMTDIELSALGLYQLQNASLAMAAVQEIEDITEEQIRNGLKNVIWQGRFEIINKSPMFIADGAHNSAGVKALIKSINAYFPDKKILYITGMFADKEYSKAAGISAEYAEKIYTVTPNNPRALSKEKFAGEFKKYNENTYPMTICDAVKECASQNECITVCFGSLSLLADIKRELTLSLCDRINLIYSHKEYKAIMSDIERLEQNRIYCRHGIEHCLDTARIAYILALEEKLNIRKDVIYAAALLHDTGRKAQYEQSDIYHGDKSVEIAKSILPDCGYSQDEIDDITSAIKNHGKQESSGLADILRKADKLSRACSNCKSIDSCNWDKEKMNMKIIY